jgi:hypothetical protein
LEHICLVFDVRQTLQGKGLADVSGPRRQLHKELVNTFCSKENLHEELSYGDGVAGFAADHVSGQRMRGSAGSCAGC